MLQTRERWTVQACGGETQRDRDLPVQRPRSLVATLLLPMRRSYSVQAMDTASLQLEEAEDVSAMFHEAASVKQRPLWPHTGCWARLKATLRCCRRAPHPPLRGCLSQYIHTYICTYIHLIHHTLVHYTAALCTHYIAAHTTLQHSTVTTLHASQCPTYNSTSLLQEGWWCRGIWYRRIVRVWLRSGLVILPMRCSM